MAPVPEPNSEPSPRQRLAELLAAVAGGQLSIAAALSQLEAGPLAGGDGFVDLGYARVDTHRVLRTGDPEVIFASGKTPEQVVQIAETLRAGGADGVLVTRASVAVMEALLFTEPGALVDELARCVLLGSAPPGGGEVLVVSAGTADAAVAAEAACTARAFGARVDRLADVGVAGVHRLLAERSRLVSADCLVVVAGLEGALPSVVGGLVGTPVVAVPTSVGYGVSAGGFAALLTMLASCTPGVAVCNIDNGFGAGVFAARVARRAAAGASTPARPAHSESDT